MQCINDGSLTVLVPQGDIQGENIKDLELSLNNLLQDKKHNIALDMEKVETIFSRGIGILMKTQKVLKEQNGGLYLYNINDTIQRVFMQSNLIGYLNCYGSKDEIDFELLSPEADEDVLSLELGLSIDIINLKPPTLHAKLGGTMDTEADIHTLRQISQDAIQNGCRELILDFTELVYLDDVAAMEIINLSKQLDDYRGKLVLQGANDIVTEQLQTMGIQGPIHYQ